MRRSAWRWGLRLSVLLLLSPFLFLGGGQAVASSGVPVGQLPWRFLFEVLGSAWTIAPVAVLVFAQGLDGAVRGPERKRSEAPGLARMIFGALLVGAVGTALLVAAISPSPCPAGGVRTGPQPPCARPPCAVAGTVAPACTTSGTTNVLFSLVLGTIGTLSTLSGAVAALLADRHRALGPEIEPFRPARSGESS